MNNPVFHELASDVFIREAIVDGRNGYLVEPGDVPAAVEQVARLLDDTDLREGFARAGRGAVAEFDQDLMVRAQETLYDELLGR